MKSHALRTGRRRAAVAAVLLAPLLTACGFGAQTDQVYQPAQGVNDRSGEVEIHNAVIVAGEDGAGTFAGTLVNTSDEGQALTSVTGDGIEAASDGVEIDPGQLANLGTGTGKNGQPLLTITGEPVKIGSFVRLTFRFAGGTLVTVNVPVVGTDPEDGPEFLDVPLPKPAVEEPAKPGKQAEPSADETDSAADEDAVE